MAAAERCQAEFDYDFKRGVPLSAFLYQRALAGAWTHIGRNGRTLATSSGRTEARTTKQRAPAVSVLESYSSSGSLQCALLELSSAERRLIRQLFWKKIPEHKVATNLKISQTGGEQHASGKSFATCAGDCWMSESLLCSQPRRFGAQRLSQLNRRPRISAGLCH